MHVSDCNVINCMRDATEQDRPGNHSSFKATQKEKPVGNRAEEERDQMAEGIGDGLAKIGKTETRRLNAVIDGFLLYLLNAPAKVPA
jgi:hypothetical protein